VFNSVNVSATLVKTRLAKSRRPGLAKLATLLEEHASDLGPFLTTDPKGRMVPQYLKQLAEHLEHEAAELVTEIDALTLNVDHIKEIVAMQQNYARVSGALEVVAVDSLVEDAVKLNAGALVRHGVQVHKEYAEVPEIEVERHRVLQILVNLIRNAKYALDERGHTDKCLTLRIGLKDPRRVQIEVADNGVGIPVENLTRIFAHGYTTRRDGHGFGLHSGALTAREMGGALHAASAGLGQGATFTLELPLKPNAG
jgi:signal transduction histidine kinase